jgi:hypothetical protein
MTYKLTVIHDNGQRRVVEVEQANHNYRLVVRWPSGAGTYEFDVIRNRIHRGVGWSFLEPYTAREIWTRMRKEIKKQYGIKGPKIGLMNAGLNPERKLKK